MNLATNLNSLNKEERFLEYWIWKDEFSRWKLTISVTKPIPEGSNLLMQLRRKNEWTKNQVTLTKEKWQEQLARDLFYSDWFELFTIKDL